MKVIRRCRPESVTCRLTDFSPARTSSRWNASSPCRGPSGVASAYERAFPEVRVPPPDFGPLPGEP